MKDLGLLGRDMKDVIMVDNAAISYKFQPLNGIECKPFINDFTDTELSEMTPFLEYLAKKNVGIGDLGDRQDIRQFSKLWGDTRDPDQNLKIFDD